MASISGRVLFFVTSPRNPLQMIPEIRLLTDNYSRKKWNNDTQKSFMSDLLQSSSFKNQSKPKDPALSARDRINRAPKALGFVDLKPTINLTEPGKQLLNETLFQEALLRQLLKFQLPSPFHKENSSIQGTYYIKPFLEILRLIDYFKKISFDELMIFGMQLTDYRDFEEVVSKIEVFREKKKANNQNYKSFVGDYLKNQICLIYRDEIREGNLGTRESDEISLERFIKTKSSNLRDYADACFRYLRATGLITITQGNRAISIIGEKQDEVKYYLKNINRKPVFIEDEEAYKQYLFNVTIPSLYTDDREKLEARAEQYGIDLNLDTPILKEAILKETQKKREVLVKEKIEILKSHKDFRDVIEVYQEILDRNYYDVPLMLEWNTWRAMTILNGGEIFANLKFDDEGNPLTTAGGSMPDIICEYEKFNLTVEVTMSSGSKQYEMEGEPIARHLAKIKKEKGKKAYCLFIAPQISEASIAYCYAMYGINIDYYGGTTEIIPLNLDTFIDMIDETEKIGNIPDSKKLQNLCEFSKEKAANSKDEKEWFNSVQQKAKEWLIAW